MSDLIGYTDLNHADLIARIERQQAETRKFVAERAKLDEEGFKLNAEALKFGAENSKLVAESRKFAAESLKLGRDHRLSPWTIAAATVGTTASVIAAIGGFIAAYYATHH